MNPAAFLAYVVRLCGIRTMAYMLVPLGWGFSPWQDYGVERLDPPWTITLNMTLSPEGRDLLFDMILLRAIVADLGGKAVSPAVTVQVWGCAEENGQAPVILMAEEAGRIEIGQDSFTIVFDEPIHIDIEWPFNSIRTTVLDDQRREMLWAPKTQRVGPGDTIDIDHLDCTVS